MISSNSTPRLRHKVVDITSIEHAAAVIRGMRSTFHSKVLYSSSLFLFFIDFIDRFIIIYLIIIDKLSSICLS